MAWLLFSVDDLSQGVKEITEMEPHKAWVMDSHRGPSIRWANDIGL